MSDEKDPAVSVIELQEEFIQHMEQGGRRILLLAAVATVAGAYFTINYFLQLVVLPFGLGITTQTVNLLDPGLMAVGAVSLVISLLWVYAGVSDLTFGRRMMKRVREVRQIQSQAAQSYGLERPEDKQPA